MKQPLFILVVFQFLFGCQEENPCSDFPFGEPLEIGLRETVTHCTEEFAISYVELISDSRCPMNVMCVWQGMIEVKISVFVQGNESTFSLSSEPNFGEKIPSSLLVDGYLVKLENALPYPEAGSSIKDQERTVVVSIQRKED